MTLEQWENIKKYVEAVSTLDMFATVTAITLQTPPINLLKEAREMRDRADAAIKDSCDQKVVLS